MNIGGSDCFMGLLSILHLPKILAWTLRCEILPISFFFVCNKKDDSIRSCIQENMEQMQINDRSMKKRKAQNLDDFSQMECTE